MTTLTDRMTTALEQYSAWQEPLLTDLHRHPELSMLEERTREIVDEHLNESGFTVQHIGGGVVGVLENGEGPVVLLRADMDGLPVEEASGLPYASVHTQADADGQVQPTMHACGHDFHTVAGLGAARLLAEHQHDWSGTFIALFPPGEEIAAGAAAMVDDGLVDKIPAPQVCLGQHVLTSPVAGKVSVAAGPMMSSSVSMRVLVHGSGSHGSMPHLGIDPVVLASAIVTRLQTLVSREIAPGDFGVVTVGALHAGTSANIIPDRAELALNFRAYSDEILDHLVEGVQRMVRAECDAARSPQEPEFELFNHYPVTDNDEGVADRVREAFEGQFGPERVEHMDPVTASEDFSVIPDAFEAPYCYWGVGAYAEGREAAPNHSPLWAPDLQPTLRVGTEAAASAAFAQLGHQS